MERAALDNLIVVIQSCIEPLGYECLELRWAEEETLQIYIDRSDGQEVGMEDCVAVNKRINESECLVRELDFEYGLEVSSPGVERPLRKPVHFRAQIGKPVEVKLEKRVQDRVHGKGVLKDISPLGDITLETSRGEWVFPLSALKSAHLVYND